MKVTSHQGGKIKVLLTKEDLSQLGLSFSAIDCSDPDTRLLLKAVYKLAALNTGEICSRRLLIEAYPHPSGGGILYFTPLQERGKTKRLRLKSYKKEAPCFNYVFSEGDPLMKAIDTLYRNPESRDLPSEVYDVEGVFLLIVYPCSPLPVLQEIKEFSGDFFQGDRTVKNTREHGKALTGKNAIREIGEKISRGSLMN